MSAVSSTRERLSTQVEVFKATYAKNVTWDAVLADAEKWYPIATSFANTSKDIGNITASLRNEADDNALALLELRALARTQTGTLSAEQRETAVNKLTAPILWLLSTSEPVLARQEFINKLPTPGDALTGLADTLGNTLAALLKPLTPYLITLVVLAIIGAIVYFLLLRKAV